MNKTAEVKEVYTFKDFIRYGIALDSSATNGIPWCFSFKGYPVTYHTNECYLIAKPERMLKFTIDDVLVTDGEDILYVCNKEVYKRFLQKDLEGESNGL